MSLTFALVGDVHGFTKAMVRQVQALEQRIQRSFDFVAQVGDFEPHRHEDDLRTMAAPTKYKQLGDFPDFMRGWATFPWPVYFIGGNHEPYGWLEHYPLGFELIPNCSYLGRVGTIQLGGLRLSGLTGVFESELYEQPRPSVQEIDHVSNKHFIGYNEADLDQLLELPRPDVLLLHEWPEGLTQDRKYAHRAAGSEQARLLIELLKPSLVACGHMHRRHHAFWEHPDGTSTEIMCLGHIRDGEQAVAAYEWNGTSFKQLE